MIHETIGQRVYYYIYGSGFGYGGITGEGHGNGDWAYGRGDGYLSGYDTGYNWPTHRYYGSGDNW
jgi:hypothetical protein